MGVGVASMLMIFVVLCLTTFAVLSYVTANADYKLTREAAEAAEAYYAADAQSAEALAQFDEQLARCEQESEAAEEEQVRARYRSLVKQITMEEYQLAFEEEGTLKALFVIPAGEEKELHMTAVVAENPAARPRYVVTECYSVDTREWESGSEDLWQG